MAIHTNTTTGGSETGDGPIPEVKINTLDKIVSEACDLYFLLETISDEMTELDYRRPDGSRNVRLDRISALIEIARRQTRTLHNVMADNYGELSGKVDRRAAA